MASQWNSPSLQELAGSSAMNHGCRRHESRALIPVLMSSYPLNAEGSAWLKIAPNASAKFKVIILITNAAGQGVLVSMDVLDAILAGPAWQCILDADPSAGVTTKQVTRHHELLARYCSPRRNSHCRMVGLQEFMPEDQCVVDGPCPFTHIDQSPIYMSNDTWKNLLDMHPFIQCI